MTAVAVDLGRVGWFQAWLLHLRWEFIGMRIALPMLVVTQTIIGAGSVAAISLWMPEVTPEAGMYVTTGAATITLVQVGLVMGPQLIANQRMRGSDQFLWSLPTPRSAAAAAWMALNLTVTVPALALTFVLGTVVYDLDMHLTPSLVPAVGAVVLVAALGGYALGHGLPNPVMVSIGSQILIFALFGFSPVLFPDRNLPGWLALAHQWLPIESMVSVIRAAVTDGLIADTARSYAVIGAWGVGAAWLAATAVGRRR